MKYLLLPYFLLNLFVLIIFPAIDIYVGKKKDKKKNTRDCFSGRQ